MLARERVRRARRALGALIAVRGLLWAAAAALAAHAVMTLLPGSRVVQAWAIPVAIGVIVLAMIAVAWRRLSIERVALWIEERIPQLRYALVTAVDPRYAGGAPAGALERAIASVGWEDRWRVTLGAAARRSLLLPAGVVALAAGAAWLATRVKSRTAAPPSAHVTVTSGRSGTGPAPFARLSATIRAPEYAGGRTVVVASPVSIAALTGSAITIGAPGTADGVTAEIAGAGVAVGSGDGRWRVAFTLGARPAVLRLRHPAGERLVTLEPRVDSAPAVRLLLPARDTVFREPRGVIALAGAATDDVGLASLAFEYIVSSGSGESFQFRSGTLAARRLRGDTAAQMRSSLDLQRLGLAAGDVAHVRAVARDANSVTGPGTGSSETRTLRVARAGEYDSIAVEGAPPPEADRSILSQRMLIMLTEALVKREPRLARQTVVGESRAIARDQTRLRRRVGDIIFARLGDDPTGEHSHGADEDPDVHDQPPRGPDSLRRGRAREGTALRDSIRRDSIDAAREALLRAASAATEGGPEILDFQGDETPIVAINRPLLEAYNAMWEASRELDQGEPRRALPPMRRALDAIQRARQAERIYLRGRAPAVVVDLARVRLAGKETGRGSARTPRPAIDVAAARRAERLIAAIARVGESPAAAVDSLTLLRVEVLSDAPALASALADALAVLRDGRDATDALARARRIAAGEVRRRDDLPAWGGAW